MSIKIKSVGVGGHDVQVKREDEEGSGWRKGFSGIWQGAGERVSVGFVRGRVK